MKIAERAGHNEQAIGAVGIINEVVENRNVNVSFKKYLEEGGASVVDCTPGRCDNNTDLRLGVQKANSSGANIFCSLHFNSFKRTSAEMGTEVLVYKNFPEAERVLNALVKLGFKNRGIKEKPGFYELKNTKMKAMIIEICFTDSEKDVELYRKLGPDAIGKALAEAILGRSIESKPNNPQQNPQKEYEQHGNATVLVDALNVRTAPSVNSTVAATYKKGETIYNYNRVYEADGYRWIRYVGSSGNYRYVAVRRLSDNKRYANCY